MENETNKETKTKSRPQWQGVNDSIIAEIGKVYLTLKRFNGHCQIELYCDCVDDTIIYLDDYCRDNHGVEIEPVRMIEDFNGFAITEVLPDVLDAVRRWCANNDIKFTRRVNDDKLIDYANA